MIKIAVTLARFVGTAALLTALAAAVWRYFLPLMDYRVHACVIGLAALYLGIGDAMAWNTISNLEKMIADAKHFSSEKLARLITAVRESRTIVLRKLAIVIIGKGVAVATAPIVFDRKVDVTVQTTLLTAGYLVVLGSFLVLWSVLRNYRESASFRDDLALEARAEEERQKRVELLKESEAHDFANDPNVQGYYTVVPETKTEGS